MRNEPSRRTLFFYSHICIRKVRSSRPVTLFLQGQRASIYKPSWKKKTAHEDGSIRILKLPMLSGLANGWRCCTMEARLPPRSLEFVLHQSILGYRSSIQWHVVTRPLSRQATAYWDVGAGVSLWRTANGRAFSLHDLYSRYIFL